MTPIEIFKAAKLEPRHLAALLGVGRVTASKWLNRHTVPHSLLEDAVRSLAARVASAVDQNQLPFPPGVKKADEVKYLQELLGG